MPKTDSTPIMREWMGQTWPRVQTRVSGPSLTRQEFAEECNINQILDQFQRTGAMSHFAKYAPLYGEFDARDYQSAQNLLIRAREMFDALPSNVRQLVSTPAGFLEFVQDPANAEKMRELGLRAPETPTPSQDNPRAGESPAGNPS